MRPRSAGSSRISKRLLPFLTEAAISSASPLNGTGALVAAVTLNDPVAATFVVAVGSCGSTAPIACRPASDPAAGVCVVSAPAECSWTVPATTDVNEGLAEASALAPSTALSAASCVPVAAAGCAVAAAGSVVPVAVPRIVRCRCRGLRRACSLGGCGFRCHCCGSGDSGRHRRRGCGGLRFHRRCGGLAWRRLSPGLRRRGGTRGDRSRTRGDCGGISDDSGGNPGIDLGRCR